MYKIYTEILCRHGLHAPKITSKRFAFIGKMNETDKQKWIMRINITTVILILSLLQVSAAGLAQKVTYSGKQISITKVFKAIKMQTGYNVLWPARTIKDIKPIDVNFKDATLEAVLNECLSGQPFTYSITRHTIIIEPDAGPSFLERVVGTFTVIDISAIVIDAQGNVLSGASVKVKGTGKTANTNASGVFNLNGVAEDAVLLISYIGYEPLEITAKEAVRLKRIPLKENIGKLDETVVIGYGTTTKRLNTGSVSTVKAEVIESQPVTDPLLALQGRVPGLYISQVSGIPGSGAVVRLRGQNSLANGNKPFYIIDGVPYSSYSPTSNYVGAGAASAESDREGLGLSPFNLLNPSDIERIDVLKDADATAIYGSRGANGVILITTKKGKSGRTKFDLNVSSGAGQTTNKLKLLNTEQYIKMRKEAFTNDDVAPGPGDYDVNGAWDSNSYTDWQKFLIGGTAHLTNVQAALSGGNSQTQFALRSGFSNQTTVYPGNYNDRKVSTLLNVTHISLNGKLRADVTASFLNNKNILPQTDFTGLILQAPNAPKIYDDFGNLNWSDFFDNPLANTKKNAQSVTENLTGSLNLSYMFFPGFNLKSSFGYNKIQGNQTNLTPITAFRPTLIDRSEQRENNYGGTNTDSWLVEPQLNYNRTIGAGNLEVLIGTSFQQNSSNMVGYRASDFVTDAAILNIASAKNMQIAGINYTLYKYNAVFSRINYNWKERYIINLTARRDGSSKFGPGKQFGNFGALGIAWIFSEENWMKNMIPFLNYGKVRASYGITGNDQIPDYQFLSTYSNNFINYQGLGGLIPARIQNADFSWEQVKKMEFALETSFFENRILFNLDFYRNRSSNQLVGYSLPSTTGFSKVQYNLPALVQNTGLEADIQVELLNTKKLNWKMNANISVPKNKLLSYPTLESSTDYFNYVIGQPITGSRSLEYIGVDPTTGLYTVRDVNNDNIINTGDYTQYKAIKQQYFGGVQQTLNYQGIQLSVFFQYVKQNGTSFSGGAQSNVSGAFNQNIPVDIYENSWRNRGNKSLYQKISTGTSQTRQANSYWQSSDARIVDASFIRLKNIMLSYSLGSEILKKLKLQNLKLYVQAQNLFTITTYKGLDPESMSGLTLPPLKMITAGMQLVL